MQVDKVLENHIPMIQSIIKGLFIPDGLDRDDLIQAGLIGVWKAYKKYKPHKKVQFSTFAYVVARNEILSVMRKQSKFMPEVKWDDLEGFSTFYEMDKDMEDKWIKEDLEQEEYHLVHYLFEGYTQREIAKILNTTQPRICQRIRQLRIKGKRKWGNIT